MKLVLRSLEHSNVVIILLVFQITDLSYLLINICLSFWIWEEQTFSGPVCVCVCIGEGVIMRVHMV